MRKILSLTLVILLVLSLSITAFAASDVTKKDYENNEFAEEIDSLFELGVFVGYSNDETIREFRPEGTFTRAESNKTMTILEAEEQLVVGYQNTPSRFTDVQLGQWYTPYVVQADNANRIDGYPDGTFKPDQGVTFMEFLAMMVKAMNGEDIAQANGGWTYGYITVGRDLNLLDELTDRVYTAPITRADSAKMIHNALLQKHWEIDTSNTNQVGTWQKNGKTFAEILGYNVETVKFTETPLFGGSLDDATATAVTSAGSTVMYEADDISSFDGVFPGVESTVWVDNDTDKVVSVEQNSVEVIVVPNDTEWVGSNGNFKVGSKSYSMDVATGFKVVDQTRAIATVSTEFSTPVDGNEVVVGNYDLIRFRVDSDNNVVGAELYNLGAPSIVAADKGDGKFLVNKITGQNTEMETTINTSRWNVPADNMPFVDADLNFVDPSTVEMDDILYSTSGTSIKFISYKSTVEGEFGRVNQTDMNVTIDGDKYDVNENYYSINGGDLDLNDIAGKMATGFYDIAGRLVSIVTEEIDENGDIGNVYFGLLEKSFMTRDGYEVRIHGTEGSAWYVVDAAKNNSVLTGDESSVYGVNNMYVAFKKNTAGEITYMAQVMPSAIQSLEFDASKERFVNSSDTTVSYINAAANMVAVNLNAAHDYSEVTPYTYGSLIDGKMYDFFVPTVTAAADPGNYFDNVQGYENGKIKFMFTDYDNRYQTADTNITVGYYEFSKYLNTDGTNFYYEFVDMNNGTKIEVNIDEEQPFVNSPVATVGGLNYEKTVYELEFDDNGLLLDYTMYSVATPYTSIDAMAIRNVFPDLVDVISYTMLDTTTPSETQAANLHTAVDNTSGILTTSMNVSEDAVVVFLKVNDDSTKLVSDGYGDVSSLSKYDVVFAANVDGDTDNTIDVFYVYVSGY